MHSRPRRSRLAVVIYQDLLNDLAFRVVLCKRVHKQGALRNVRNTPQKRSCKWNRLVGNNLSKSKRFLASSKRVRIVRNGKHQKTFMHARFIRSI
jgi:hypothetical protein